MQQVRDQSDLDFMGELTRRYGLPGDVEVSICRQADTNEQTLVFCISSEESKGRLLNECLPNIVRLAADLKCQHLLVQRSDQPPSKILKLDTDNLKRLLIRLGQSF